jgi:hypothetical protein
LTPENTISLCNRKNMAIWKRMAFYYLSGFAVISHFGQFSSTKTMREDKQ